LREEAQTAAKQHSSVFEMEEKERIDREKAAKKILEEGTAFADSPTRRCNFSLTILTLSDFHLPTKHWKNVGNNRKGKCPINKN
jgi:hypothetical protein